MYHITKYDIAYWHRATVYFGLQVHEEYSMMGLKHHLLARETISIMRMTESNVRGGIEGF